MNGQRRLRNIILAWWPRFWYAAFWRVSGVLLAALTVRNIIEGEHDDALLTGIFAVTYLVVVPVSLTRAFQTGYGCGMRDMFAYAVGGDDSALRPFHHPADVLSEAKRPDGDRDGRGA